MKVKCKTCGKPLGRINFENKGLQPTDDVFCNDCALKEFDISV